MSGCGGRGGCRTCRRRRRIRRCCRRRIRIPKALLAGVLFALALNNIGSILNPVSNNNINIINLNRPKEEDECPCEEECESDCKQRCRC